MGWVVKNAPNAVVTICGTVVLVVLIGTIGILSWGGKSSDEVVRLVNTLLNTLGLLVGTGSLLFAGAAANSARQAADQTNGPLQEQLKKVAEENKDTNNG